MTIDRPRDIVRRALDELTAAVTSKDVDAATRLQDPDAFVVGSSAGEFAEGLAGLSAFFSNVLSQPYVIRWEWDSPVVRRDGSAIWFFVEGTLHVARDATTTAQPYRLSAVLRESGQGQWRWAMFHGSEPAPSL